MSRANSPTPSPPSPSSASAGILHGSRAHALAIVVLIVAVSLAYANSFRGAFLLDDFRSIVDNPSIRQLWPLSEPLTPTAPLTLNGRPVVNLSFAFDHALHGASRRGLHATNLAIHLAAALALFGLVRRTCERIAPPSFSLSAPPPEMRATALAFSAALIWALHPLQTESVTYLVQRVESLMGLFFLLTLYCLARGASSPAPQRWTFAAVAACALGMGSKEVMVSAPIVALLYDRAFLAGSFRAAWRTRRSFYFGLAATWPLLAWLVIAAKGRGGSAGFGTPLAWHEYALTQAWAVTHYLRLTLWPHPLVFDYGPALVQSAAKIIAGLIAVLALAGASLVALLKNRAAGFLGASFFVVLAPSSSVVPVATQTIAEHRMYLPLAAVVAGAAALLFTRVPCRAALAVCAGVGIVCGALTFRRNADYADPVALWSKTIAVRPENARAHDHLARALQTAGRLDDALHHHRRAVELAPHESLLWHHLGATLLGAGRHAEASRALVEAVQLAPENAAAHSDLALALLESGQPAAARRPAAEAVRLAPEDAGFRYNFGTTLLRTGEPAAAAEQFRAALERRPSYAEAQHDLGAALAQAGDLEAARDAFAAAARLDPTDRETRQNLANVLGMLGRYAEAAAEFETLLRAHPDFHDARFGLAQALWSLGRREQALAQIETVLRADPTHVGAREALAQWR